MAKDEIFQFSSIDKSPLIELDGETLVDLLANPIFASKVKDIERVIIVSVQFAGKPHLIVKSVYGSFKDLDLFFSINGYSNPLTVKAGDVLVVPRLEDLQKNSIATNKINRSAEEIKKRLSTVDKKRLEFLNPNGSLVSPNINESRKQFSEKANRVISLGNGNNQSEGYVEIRNKALSTVQKQTNKAKIIAIKTKKI